MLSFLLVSLARRQVRPLFALLRCWFRQGFEELAGRQFHVCRSLAHAPNQSQRTQQMFPLLIG